MLELVTLTFPFSARNDIVVIKSETNHCLFRVVTALMSQY